MSDDHIHAHEFSSNHRDTLQNDELGGCFYCLKIFHPSEITIWIEDIAGTAMCPHCGIDSVIGKSSGYPITKDFLAKMRKHWFSKSKRKIHHNIPKA